MARQTNQEERPPRPTMADVARRAGVSTMTVSRALKPDGVVSQDVRAKIIAVAEELGYVLDMSAGSLSSKKTGFVAGIVPSLNNSNFSDTARGITDGLAESGLQLLLGYTEYSMVQEEKLIELMLRRRPEGMILTGGHHTDRARRLLMGAGIPIIETWDLPADPIDRVVGFSNSEAMELLVGALVRKGYTRFGYIGGTTERDTRGSERRAGVQRCLEKNGLDPSRIISFGVPPITVKQGGEAIITLLEKWPDTEIVLCVSDMSAFGALMECQRRGLRVPEDVAIAGFGNYEIGAYSHPRISTIDVECYTIGRLAAQSLRDGIRGVSREGDLAPYVQTRCGVILREST